MEQLSRLEVMQIEYGAHSTSTDSLSEQPRLLSALQKLGHDPDPEQPVRRAALLCQDIVRKWEAMEHPDLHEGTLTVPAAQEIADEATRRRDEKYPPAASRPDLSPAEVRHVIDIFLERLNG